MVFSRAWVMRLAGVGKTGLGGQDVEGVPRNMLNPMMQRTQQNALMSPRQWYRSDMNAQVIDTIGRWKRCFGVGCKVDLPANAAAKGGTLMSWTRAGV